MNALLTILFVIFGVAWIGSSILLGVVCFVGAGFSAYRGYEARDDIESFFGVAFLLILFAMIGSAFQAIF